MSLIKQFYQFFFNLGITKGSFRGRCIMGKEINIPEGFKGLFPLILAFLKTFIKSISLLKMS